MDAFFSDIKRRFQQKDILIQLIVINVAVFLTGQAIQVVAKLFNLHGLHLIDYLGLSSDVSALVRFWTPFTYMFVHQEILHILFNMLVLYWFGQLFLASFSPKILGSLYILGGLAGAALYILAFNTIPYFVSLGPVPLIGASASIMALVFGIAFYRPNMSIRLLLVGEIKIVYIAIFFFVLDFFYLAGSNAGGHVAHIGGAILGYLFAIRYSKGKDITRWITRIIDSFINASKPGQTAKTGPKFEKRESDYDYNKRIKKNKEEIDAILDKIKASGYASLSEEEKQKLFKASDK